MWLRCAQVTGSADVKSTGFGPGCSLYAAAEGARLLRTHGPHADAWEMRGDLGWYRCAVWRGPSLRFV